MYKELIKKALQLRRDTFQAFVEHGEAHLGGSFSMIEMLVALYEEILEEEDKGEKSMVLWSCLYW